MNLRHRSCCLLAILLFPGLLQAQSNDLLTRIWAGEQQAQAKITNACGNMTETRTSPLMTKPMVLHGRFCTEGTDRFMLDYAAPNSTRIRLNGSYLNITAGGKTEVRNIDRDIHHAESSFAGENSLDGLEKNFDITAQDTGRDYEMKLVPRAQNLRRTLNYLVVKINKQDFLPRSLEIDGKSGVNSIFIFDVTSTNTRLPEDTFEVIKK